VIFFALRGRRNTSDSTVSWAAGHPVVRHHRTHWGARMTSRTDIGLNRKGKIPWYVYFVGGVIYTVLAGWLFAESSPLAWVCLISAPVGFFYAWGAWKKEKQG